MTTIPDNSEKSPNAYTAKAREIVAEFRSTLIDEAVPEYFPKLVSAIASALREAEAGERAECALIADIAERNNRDAGNEAKDLMNLTTAHRFYDAADAAMDIGRLIRSRSETDE